MSDLHIAGANLIKPIEAPGSSKLGKPARQEGPIFGLAEKAIGHINDAQAGPVRPLSRW